MFNEVYQGAGLAGAVGAEKPEFLAPNPLPCGYQGLESHGPMRVWLPSVSIAMGRCSRRWTGAGDERLCLARVHPTAYRQLSRQPFYRGEIFELRRQPGAQELYKL